MVSVLLTDWESFRVHVQPLWFTRSLMLTGLLLCSSKSPTENNFCQSIIIQVCSWYASKCHTTNQMCNLLFPNLFAVLKLHAVLLHTKSPGFINSLAKQTLQPHEGYVANYCCHFCFADGTMGPFRAICRTRSKIFIKTQPKLKEWSTINQNINPYNHHECSWIMLHPKTTN